MRVRFDRFYTYAELTETLEAWAAAFPTQFSFESIGTSYEGRDIWLCTVTNAETGLGGREARGVRPCADPRDGVHGDDRGAPSARPPPPLRGHARSARRRHAHVLRRPAREPGRRRCRARRRPLPPLERPAVSARRARGRAAPRGRRRRRARPLHAHARSQRLVESASGRPARADRAAPGRRRGRLLPRAPRGDDRELGRREHPDRAAARGSRPQPQLARGLGARGGAAGRRAVPDLRARGARARRGDRRAQEHHLVCRLPHLLGRSPAPVVRPLGRRLPGARPPRLQAHGRGSDAHHRLSRRSRSSTTSSTTRRW